MTTNFNAEGNCPVCGRQLAYDTLEEEEGFDLGSFRQYCLNGDYDAFFGPEGQELEVEG